MAFAARLALDKLALLSTRETSISSWLVGENIRIFLSFRDRGGF
jgi:hypothetical protein